LPAVPFQVSRLLQAQAAFQTSLSAQENTYKNNPAYCQPQPHYLLFHVKSPACFIPRQKNTRMLDNAA
jgi:hypothetical protein